MKRPKIVHRIAFSSWFLALIPAVIVCLLIPPLGHRYSLQIENSANYNGQIIYEDLNGDGNTEQIYAQSAKPYNAVVVTTNEGRIYDQWNVPDSMTEYLSELNFGDFDHNGFKEIYLFTVHLDSLFLNINEFFNPKGIHFQHLFITKVQLANNIVVSSLNFCGFYDEDGDGKDEFYFGLQSGYGREPRRIYCYNLIKRSILSSSFTGNIPFDLKMEDMDGDFKPEIFGSMTAPGNYKWKVPYTDSSTWLMVFNPKLKFKFPPVEFKGYTNGLTVRAFQAKTEKFYILLHTYGGVDSTIMKAGLMLFSTAGKMKMIKSLDELGITKFPTLLVMHGNTGDKIVVVGKKIYNLSSDLSISETSEIPVKSQVNSFLADINNDGYNELLIYSPTEKTLLVFNSKLQLLAKAQINIPYPVWRYSYTIEAGKERKLFLKSKEINYFIILQSHPNYIFGYLIYPGIYFAIFLFILLIRRINTYQLAQRENLKRRLMSLQLQSIKSQLDPHFTFNALNSISALIYEEDRQSAYDHMNQFTLLLRRMLNDADQVYRNLRDELEFVSNYLDLEKLRFGTRLDYEIQIADDIKGNEQVPKMVLQTFAENAIKHGLMPKPEGGRVLIKAEIEGKNLKLTIEDNGIGRAKSAGTSTSTGRGLRITDEFYEILNQMNEEPIRLEINDLYDESCAGKGTRVEVWVPLNTNSME